MLVSAIQHHEYDVVHILSRNQGNQGNNIIPGEHTYNTKGTFHAKMSTIKDRNGMDLTEAEDIKNWQKNIEELYKKDLHDPDNHDGVITHLHPGIRSQVGVRKHHYKQS